MRGLKKKSSYLLLIFCLLFLTHHFSLGNRLETLPTINPAINWHTYLGSQSYDACQAIAVDRQGSICLVGLSKKTWGKPRAGMLGRQNE